MTRVMTVSPFLAKIGTILPPGIANTVATLVYKYHAQIAQMSDSPLPIILLAQMLKALVRPVPPSFP